MLGRSFFESQKVVTNKFLTNKQKGSFHIVGYCRISACETREKLTTSRENDYFEMEISRSIISDIEHTIYHTVLETSEHFLSFESSNATIHSIFNRLHYVKDSRIRRKLDKLRFSSGLNATNTLCILLVLWMYSFVRVFYALSKEHFQFVICPI